MTQAPPNASILPAASPPASARVSRGALVFGAVAVAVLMVAGTVVAIAAARGAAGANSAGLAGGVAERALAAESGIEAAGMTDAQELALADARNACRTLDSAAPLVVVLAAGHRPDEVVAEQAQYDAYADSAMTWARSAADNDPRWDELPHVVGAAVLADVTATDVTSRYTDARGWCGAEGLG